MGFVAGSGAGRLADFVANAVPLQLDAVYRLNTMIGLGAYAGYAPADTRCAGSMTCGASSVRLGLQGQIRFLPASGLSPWVGVAGGYEWLSRTVLIAGETTDYSLSGWEVVGVQGGIDFDIVWRLSGGPFASFALGRYSTAGVNDGTTGIDHQATHEWLTVGLRVTLSLP